MGKKTRAAAALARAERAGTTASALLHEATSLLRAGRPDLAAIVAQQGLGLTPNDARLLDLAGTCALRLGNRVAAEQFWRRTLQADPGNALAHVNLGALLEDRDPREAEDFYRRATARDARCADAYFNLGNLLKRHGRLADAEQAYRTALEIDPKDSEAWVNLANLLSAAGRGQEAESCCREALALDPTNARVHSNLGSILAGLGRADEAERAYRTALSIDPACSDVYYNLGMLLKNLKRLGDAEAVFRGAVKVRADDSDSRVELVNVTRSACAWAALGEDESALLAHLDGEAPLAANPFPLLAIGGIGPADLKEIARRHALTSCEAELAVEPLVQPHIDYRHARLRIGYLSADFREHAVAYLFAAVLEAHDRAGFVVHGYSYGPDTGDPVRRRVAAACDVFRDLRPIGNEAAARQIASDEIDLLVDLTGFTRGCRPEIQALRPAPVVVNWLGYPGTLGHPRLADYIIGDPVVTPLDHAGHFSETLALMPHCYQPNDRRRAIGPRPGRAEAGLPESGFVFCSFNQAFKLSPELFDVWCRLLHAVPESVVWLLRPDEVAMGNLAREAAARGIDPDRLVFAPHRPLAEHLGRLQLADLALDTFPYTSHTTGSDALWAGVPVVTRIGETFAARVAASLLGAVGLPELVVRGWDDYVALATALAVDRERLAAVRARLEQGRLDAPLFDTWRFTRDLERLYGLMRDQNVSGSRAPIVP